MVASSSRLTPSPWLTPENLKMTAPVPQLDLQDIRAAAQRIAPHVLHTPVALLQGRHVDLLIREMASVHLKLELFQRTGTAKARGALNAVLCLSAAERERGITAFSAGNHAIAAAFAAKVAGAPAKLVVQASANPVRLAAVRSYGFEVLIEPDGPSAFARADQLVRDEGRVMIHPFEGMPTSAGAGALGLELIEDLPELDAVIVAIGGGGLASGLAAAVKALRPQCRVFGVEPEGADAMRRSFEAGAPARVSAVTTICDSLAPPMTLPYSFGLCRAHIERVVTVSDDDLCHAMALLFHDAKLAVEPAGAAALAAAVGPLRDELKGLRVGLIVCGANIDREGFCRFLQRGEARLE